jgi:hypothetical protein
MISKEKAIQLIDAFDEYAESRISDDGRGFDKKYCSKQCALIVVDEILSTIVSTHTDYGASWTYWMEVKKEIENL